MKTDDEDGQEDVDSYHGQEVGDPKGTEVYNTRWFKYDRD